MSADTKLKLVLCWHMHQPEYRDLRTGEYELPWTYLHIIKDYADMAAHLEAVPEAKAVVNFAPVLLEQIEDYAKQTHGFLHDGIAIRDPLLAALVEAAIPASLEKRMMLIKACLKAHRGRQIDRYSSYKKLVRIADWLCSHPDATAYVNSQYIADLLVWYHLAWMGETTKRCEPRVKRLLEKGSGYTLHERRELLAVINELCASLINRYRALAQSGQIELSVSPYAHPIMPLMLDLHSAHEAMPDAPLPSMDRYPGGEQRVRWHLQKGRETFVRFFGFEPKGCWPSEGSVSDAAVTLISEAGYGWAASGGNVLSNSLSQAGWSDDSNWFQGFKLPDNSTVCFFRDDGLSDLIGFEYSSWHADDAVSDLIQHLENIRENHHNRECLVSIIMDGENAWEHYPENGYHFLNALYSRLAEHSQIELTTFSGYLDGQGEVAEIPHLVAGSWVYGTFSTWIGDIDKNRGWDMLGDAKWCFDKIVATGRLNEMEVRRAELQLAVCEGSDWFWWFGDYNPEEAVSTFERQFRMNLANLYQILGEEPPSYLTEIFAHGSGAPLHGGAMRRGAEVSSA